MRKLNLILCILAATFIFMGCTKNRTTALDNSGSSDDTGIVTKDTDSKEVVTPTDMAMNKFFLPDGSKAHFQGEGNEFAELDIEVAHPYENYVIIYENNGGSFVRYIYKIEHDEILILDKQIVEEKADFPSQSELEAMTSTGIYLKLPFLKGTTFDDWTIVDTDITLATPYQTFDHVFVIEQQEDSIINRKYFVEGFGEVKRESIMTTDGNGEYIVTSTLKAVDQ